MTEPLPFAKDRNPSQPSRVGFPVGLIPAGERDEQAVFDFLMLAHADNGLAPMSDKKAWMMIRRATRERCAVIVIAPGPEGIEALACFDLTPAEWYSDEWIYVDRVFFVHPAHRRSGHADRIFQFIKWWAQETGVPVVCGVSTRNRLEAKIRLFSRLGPQIGAAFVVEPIIARDAA